MLRTHRDSGGLVSYVCSISSGVVPNQAPGFVWFSSGAIHAGSLGEGAEVSNAVRLYQS